MHPGRWTAGRVIAAITIWTLIGNGLWVLIVAVCALAAVARWDLDAASRHCWRGLYACGISAAVVLVGRSLYFHTQDRHRG